MNANQNNGAPGQQPTPTTKQNNLAWSTPGSKPAAPAAKAPVVAAKPPAAAPAATTNAAKITGWLAAGVVAGVLIAWAGTALVKQANTEPVANGALQTTTSTTPSSDASLVVTDPQKAGLTVAIESVAVSQPTWVVVYESQDGKPGNVLGAAIFSPQHTSGTVDLLRGTRAGQTYFVTEHSDNGDRQFSLKGDPLLTEGGQPVWVSFTAN